MRPAELFHVHYYAPSCALFTGGKINEHDDEEEDVLLPFSWQAHSHSVESVSVQIVEMLSSRSSLI